jgi:hypothetical protein
MDLGQPSRSVSSSINRNIQPIRSVCSLTTARWWNILCKSVDPEGDALLNTGAFQPDGLSMIKSIAATGKWAANVGANWIGKTTIQAGENATIYTFTPTN